MSLWVVQYGWPPCNDHGPRTALWHVVSCKELKSGLSAAGDLRRAWTAACWRLQTAFAVKCRMFSWG
jgi:hypothetical protein